MNKISMTNTLPQVQWLKKAWLMIRLIMIFITAALLQVNARSMAQKITLSVRHAQLESLFDQIRQQSGYHFVYTDGLLQQAKPVSIEVKEGSLEEVLQQLFREQPISYTIDKKTVVIQQKGLVDKVRDFFASDPVQKVPVQQFITVTGRIVDSLHQAIAGATIRVVKGNGSISSGANGSFKLTNITPGATLRITAMGYSPKEVTAAEQVGLVVLSVSESPLDEVQVIAYGTTTRRLSTGNVATVTSDEIDKQPVSNPLATLQGRVPGMIITQTTGLPGGAFKVEVRGRTAIDRSISDDQPLFVIDGVPFGPNNGYLNTQFSALGYPTNSQGATSPGGISPLNSINIQDIESIDVLKDADATAIYGSRGANGVILITTKKGKVGSTKVSFNGSTGVSKVTHQTQMMDTRQYINMRKEAYSNDGSEPTISDGYDLLAWDTTRYTNFAKLFTDKSAVTNDAQLSVSGGNTNTQFLIGGSFKRQTSVLPGDQSYQRGTLHYNINHTSTNNKLKIDFSGSFNTDRNNTIYSDLSAYYYMPPNLIVYNNKGNLAWDEGGVSSYSNPLSYLNLSYLARNKGLASNILVNYTIMNGLNIRISTGYNTSILNELSLRPISSANPHNDNNTGSSSSSDNQFTSWIVEPQLEYVRNIAKGKLDVLIGSTAQAINQEGKSVDASDFTSDDLLRSFTGAPTITASSTKDQYRYYAFFARLNYNWKDTYILNLSARRDGSSRFAPENRYANFGSAGAAWIFTNEAFLKDHTRFLSFGKLRSSYGTTGNDKITNYQFLDTWSSSYSTYNGAPGLYPDKLYNPNYHWEKTNKFEAALELGFLSDKLVVSSVYYQNRSSNQLVQYPLPITTGFSNIIDNLPALVENKGWEFTINATNVKSKNFTWSSSVNITLPKNTLISYPGLASSSYYGQYVVGQSLNTIYKYTYMGIDPNTGIYQFRDVDGNGSFNVLDRQVQGSLDPKFYGGLSNSFHYKNLQLDIFFSFTKQQGKNFLSVLRSMPGTMNNLPAAMIGEFWEKPGDQATYQKLSANNNAVFAGWNNFQNSGGAYSDASFVRLKNIELSYSLPKQWVEKVKFRDCRIYLQAQNLFTFTGFKAVDPETQNLNRTAPMRTIVAGIQFNL